MTRRVLVVGAGPGGVAAAVQLKRLGVLVRWWDRTGEIGGLLHNAQRVENWPGMPVGASGQVCCVRLREHAAAFDLKPEKVEASSFSETDGAVLVRGSDDTTASVDAVVWAPGTRPIPWALARPELPVVYEFRDIPAQARRVLFVGGGEAACDGSLHWAQGGREAILAVRSDRLRAGGGLAQRTLASEIIDRRFCTEVIALAWRDDGLQCTLRSAGVESVASVDAVVFCGGRLSALPSLGLAAPGTGQLRVCPSHWVVGDARLGSLGQACIALGDGLLAAGQVAESAEIQGK